MSVIDLFTRKYASTLLKTESPAETKKETPSSSTSTVLQPSNSVIAENTMPQELIVPPSSYSSSIPDTPSKKQVSFRYPEYEEKYFLKTDKIIPSPQQEISVQTEPEIPKPVIPSPLPVITSPPRFVDQDIEIEEEEEQQYQNARMSPNTLQMRLRSELNLLEVYQESNFQLQALEHANTLNRGIKLYIEEKYLYILYSATRNSYSFTSMATTEFNGIKR